MIWREKEMGRFRLSKRCRSGKQGGRISRSAQRDKIVYLDSLGTRATKIPGVIPRVSAWSKKLVHKVLDMDLKDNGSFGKCLLKKTPAANTNSMGVSSASAMFRGVPEIANFITSNVSPGYSPQKKEVLCNAVGKLCATITNALSKFMHEVSELEGSSGEEASRDSRATVLKDKNVEKHRGQMDEDALPEDSSELRTEDTEDTDECGDETSVDGGSTGDSADDPNWEEHFNCSR